MLQTLAGILLVIETGNREKKARMEQEHQEEDQVLFMVLCVCLGISIEELFNSLQSVNVS